MHYRFKSYDALCAVEKTVPSTPITQAVSAISWSIIRPVVAAIRWEEKPSIPRGKIGDTVTATPKPMMVYLSSVNLHLQRNTKKSAGAADIVTLKLYL